jgi:hypothetical protein
MIKVSDDDRINEYVEKLRHKGYNTVKVFENSLDFVMALRTDVGKQLLKDLVAIHSEYFDRMIAEDTKDWEKGVYRELTRILTNWTTRISNYEKGLDDYSAAQKAALNK